MPFADSQRHMTNKALFCSRANSPTWETPKDERAGRTLTGIDIALLFDGRRKPYSIHPALDVGTQNHRVTFTTREGKRSGYRRVQ
jgi:hypothetical protein